MSDTIDTTDTTPPTTTEMPAQTVQPAEVPSATSSKRTTGWFSRGWRAGVAAAVIVVVAGAFFTIGWFTSTRGDHNGLVAREISQRMNLRGWGSQQSPAGQQTPRQSQGQPNPGGQSPSTTQPSQQAPSTSQAYLGVGLITATPALQQQNGLSSATGALVASVDRSGPAFQAGIRQGDVITSIDGTSVATQQDVVTAVAKKNTGDTVSVTIDRYGQSQTFQVTLGSRQSTVSQ